MSKAIDQLEREKWLTREERRMLRKLRRGLE
jgi:hypothetical protein